MGLIDIASAILSRAFERTEISAQNLTNMTTPGFKAQRWSALLGTGGADAPNAASSIDFSPGSLRKTDNPLDLAIVGNGFFVVRWGDGVYLTRNGQFKRDGEGRLVTAGGAALQSASGGDVITKTAEPRIANDGILLEGSEPVARLAIVEARDPKTLKSVGAGIFEGMWDAVASGHVEVRQGMLEASNVATADEMIAIMAALRSAESGQKIAQVYDDVMGRVLNAFGQS